LDDSIHLVVRRTGWLVGWLRSGIRLDWIGLDWTGLDGLFDVDDSYNEEGDDELVSKSLDPTLQHITQKQSTFIMFFHCMGIMTQTDPRASFLRQSRSASHRISSSSINNNPLPFSFKHHTPSLNHHHPSPRECPDIDHQMKE
jgi:hypothetical protein